MDHADDATGDGNVRIVLLEPGGGVVSEWAADRFSTAMEEYEVDGVRYEVMGWSRRQTASGRTEYVVQVRRADLDPERRNQVQE